MSTRMKRPTEYNVYYRNMRGVDLSGDGSTIAANRFAYLENMYHDYDGDGDSVTESIPGFRKLFTLGGKTHRIAGFQSAAGADYAVFHVGTSLYRVPIEERDLHATLQPIATAADRDSGSFAFGTALYLLDGSHITKITATSAEQVGNGDALPYVPTTYRNGKEYQQRNLLSSSFRESYTLSDAEDYAYGTAGLHYRILDSVNKECALCGCDNTVAGKIYIPTQVRIGADFYTVAEIADFCFRQNGAITAVVAANGIRRVGVFAFSECTNLTSVVLPDSVVRIDNAAFNACPSLTTLRVGGGLASLGSSVFSMSVLQTFLYGGTPEMFAQVENTSVIGGSAEIQYNIPATEIAVELPILSPAASITSVKVDGVEQTFSLRTDGEHPVGVLLFFNDRASIDGKEVVYTGTLQNGKSTGQTIGGFLSAHPAFVSAPDAAILGCLVAEAYDGRIFLSGNPAFPNTVFYSERDDTGANNPLYFGELNYFTDGVGPFPVNALLSVGGSLAVFKAGDDGTGSIFYHTARETGIDLLPKIYPVENIHSGIAAKGPAISFFDDPVFISENGLSALAKTAIQLERSVVTRSHNVNNYLLSENLSAISAAIWCGYLVLGAGKNWYLADSRKRFTHPTGAVEYEWFYLTGIGAFSSDRRVYRYAAEAPSGLSVYAAPDARVTATVYSSGSGEETVYYTDEYSAEQDALVQYAVYPTEEFEGGTFSPSCALCAMGDLLFFGTENGQICLFNNDKRGEAPDALRADPAFSEEEYRKTMGRRIHPSFYAFDRHAPRYAAKTKMDDCGIPHLTKSSVKRSLVLKLRSFAHSRLICEVITDRGNYTEIADLSGDVLNFSDLDFSGMALTAEESFSFAIAEREKKWTEKQIALYTDTFCSPIGLYSAAYRFTVAGKLKN